MVARDQNAELQKETANTRDSLASANKLLEVTNAKLDAANYALGVSDYARTIDQTDSAYKDQQFARTRELLAEAKAEYRGWEYDYLHRLSYPDALTIRTPDSHISVLCVSPDGNRFASASGARNANEKMIPPVVRVWNSRTAEAVNHFSLPAEFKSGIASLAFTPSGELVGLCGDGTVLTWDVATGQERERRTLPVPSGANSFQLTLDARLAGIGTADAFVLYAVATGKQTAKVERATTNPPVWSWVFSADGTRAASLEIHSTARVFDVATGKSLGSFAVFSTSSRSLSVALNANGKTLAVSGQTTGRPGTQNGPETIKLWDVDRKRLRDSLTDMGGSRLWLAPDGKRVVGVRRVQLKPDDPAVVWAPGREYPSIIRMLLVSGPPNVAAFSPDGNRIVCAHPNGILRVWNVDIDPEITVRRMTGPVTALSPDARLVLSWTGRHRFAAFDTHTGEPIGLPITTQDECRWILGPADSRAVELHHHDSSGWAQLWDLSANTIIARLAPKDAAVSQSRPKIVTACFTHDGKRVATIETGAVRVWDATTGAELSNWPLQTGQTKIPDTLSPGAPTTAAEFTLDGGLLVGTPDGRIRIFDPTTSEIRRAFTGSAGLSGLTLSPDGQTLFTRSGKSAALWDVQTGMRKAELRGHGTAITSACFSPDGRRIVTGTAGGNSDNHILDRAVHVWDVTTGRELLRLGQGQFTGAIRWITFAPDGHKLIAVGGRVVTFDSTPLNREFSPQK